MTMEVERHPGPWIGEDAELARACAMAAIRDYGSDDPDTHQRILTNGVWNDHVAVQAALAAIHNLRKAGLCETGATPRQQLEFLTGEVRKALAIFAALPLPEYFQRTAAGEKFAVAIEQASDHLAVALNVLSAQPKQLDTCQRPEGSTVTRPHHSPTENKGK